LKPTSDILERIKIRAEDEVLERIEEHPFYRREIAGDVAELVAGGIVARDHRTYLTDQLRIGTELTRVSYDTLFRLVDDASAALGVSVSARLFKSPNPSGSENACIVASGDDVIIAFHSGILNAVNSTDLLRAIDAETERRCAWCRSRVSTRYGSWTPSPLMSRPWHLFSRRLSQSKSCTTLHAIAACSRQ